MENGAQEGNGIVSAIYTLLCFDSSNSRSGPCLVATLDLIISMN
jgi:hypothetical protein